MTGGKIPGVPNQPKTPVRGFRIPTDLYRRAKAYAERDGESLTAVVVDAFDRYVRRKERADRKQEPAKGEE